MVRALGALAVWLCACGQPGAYDRYETFVSPGGDYRIRYLHPPWELVDGEGAPVRFRVTSNSARYGGIDAAAAPRYDLSVTVERGDPASRARRDARRAASRDEEVTVPVREVRTASGVRGWEVLTRQTVELFRHRRYVYLEHPRGALRLFFDAAIDLDDREVRVMIEGVEVPTE